MSIMHADALADAALEVNESWQRADHDYNADRWARALATLELARERYISARIALDTNVRQEQRKS